MPNVGFVIKSTFMALAICGLPFCSAGSATGPSGSSGGSGGANGSSGAGSGSSSGGSGSGGSGSGASSSGGSSSGLSSSGSGGSSNSSSGSSSGSSGSTSSGSSGGTVDAGSGPPPPPGIQYFGRWDFSDPNNPIGAWGSIGLKANFEGTSVAIKISDSQNAFEFSIDGGAIQVLDPPLQMTTMLASGLADGTHKLEFWRRTEGSWGSTVVSGLVLDPGKNVLSPDPRPPHKIEVLGDSISAGLRDEIPAPYTAAPDATNENGLMAYGPQLARQLDAEWSIIAQSGHGVYQNLCGSAGTLMPDEFKLTGNPDAVTGGSMWDFTKWQADVLIVLLGTNDFANGGGACATPTGVDAPFTAAYENLLVSARSVYPGAEIFAVGTFLADGSNQFTSCNSDINTAVTHMNDTHMHFVDPSTGMWLIGPTDYAGDWTHPTDAGQTKIANQLAGIIKPVLGW